MANAEIINDQQIVVEGVPSGSSELFRLATENDADIPLTIQSVVAGSEPNSFLLTIAETLSTQETYLLTAGTEAAWTIAPSMFAVFVSVIIASALISNFVFTKYLGLCVFFGVSSKKETALGMGVTFTIVGLFSGGIAWALNHIALEPLKLEFLQIVAFIGIIASLVQATDMIVKKLNPILHAKFGIFLVLITTNCIILAVPLLNATANAGLVEAMGLAAGSGLGFALALFLMACAREKVDMAPVPLVFKGLPISFILAGLFALAFMGFSGLKVA
jgi:electron transport complex protein RnfA